eukprot:8735224-Alexandrium_andersonii.AAC.1
MEARRKCQSPSLAENSRACGRRSGRAPAATLCPKRPWSARTRARCRAGRDQPRSEQRPRHW